MLRRILAEMNRQLNLKLEIPQRPEALPLAFANGLHLAAAKSRFVLIVDGLDQLEDRDGAHDLVWLPAEIPSSVRLVVSTLPGRALEELAKRQWPSLTVQPLPPSARQRFVTEFLAEYTKSLDPAQVARIAASPQTANPLYLKTLLEELRVFGSYEQLDTRIRYYLNANTVPDLYQRVLRRWEEDYECDREGLVRDTFTLIWASRRGLSEPELLELLGSNGEPLARGIWSPLWLAAERSLLDRSGLFDLSHAYLREAIQQRVPGQSG